MQRHSRRTHNSAVTDNASDGRPWPVDPVETEPDPPPVPDVDGLEEAAQAVAAFADSVERSQAVGQVPRQGEGQTVVVTDDDRNRYGALLDSAAERGLLEPYEYEVRLGELATATSHERMREIVTDLPLLTTPPATAARKRARSARRSPARGAVPETVMAKSHGHRRSSPWVLLAMVLVVFVAAMVFFSIYAEHLLHEHHTGILPIRHARVAYAASGRLLSSLRP